MDARRLGLLPDCTPPVVDLKDALMLEDKSAVGELRRQTDDKCAEHIAAPRGVLVGCKMASCLIDIEVVEFRGRGVRNLRRQFTADLLKDAGLGRVEVKNGKGAVLSFDL